MKKAYIFLFCLTILQFSFAQAPKTPYKSTKFEQLGTQLPTPNTYRAADGSPGHDYWQQKADYKIKVSLDDKNQNIKGSETITYHNNSPSDLQYLWLQLDQNLFKKDSDTYKTAEFGLGENVPFQMMGNLFSQYSKKGYEISNVKDENGKALTYVINKTMMRIDLPKPLKAKGGKFTFSLDWSSLITDIKKDGGRGGFEYFPNDKNYLYEIAQWFPRMAVYDDVNGWQNKQFLGQGEFALTFGDYQVEITVPDDHIVASTGELQNANKILTETQLKRLKEAENSSNPVVIVTQQEAEANEKNTPKGTKTWIFHAQNVRDFAFATSRKFIWDAMRTNLNGKKIWSMSYYPKEGNPLWGQYSTRVIDLTLKVYSKHTIDYPYPVAISVHGAVFGMEYPMISFNGGRPDANGTVRDGTRNAMVSVIIHEVGHNFFPMIINSDERQWSWMDEGLNTFMQYITECEVPKQEWAKKDYPVSYPSSRGPASRIVNYMNSSPDQLVPIMTNSESIIQFGNNAYGKPATALNILRETIMGRELFDFSFKKYAQRWAFKHPQPADLFRTMEDASAVDLDWFWKGWFYGTEPCDISLEEVNLYTTKKLTTESVFPAKTFKENAWEDIIARMEKGGMLLTNEEKNAMNDKKFFYELKFKNIGGLIMPIIIDMQYKDGSVESIRIPAEIWRQNPEQVKKVVSTDKEVVQFTIDSKLETADVDIKNNTLPRKENSSKFEDAKDKK
ncbi:MAG: M1 family peptidase [Cytophagia bacterium]|nr:MAG: M1 family peptidase [Cytophagia bacterium]TAG43015.1 MAG: M1 family peptidase [Cytophagia bacterium]